MNIVKRYTANLFDATGVSAQGMNGLIFPGTNNTCVPAKDPRGLTVIKDSGVATPINNVTPVVCGGLLSLSQDWSDVLLDFIGLGTGNLIFEVGKVNFMLDDGSAFGLGEPLASVTLSPSGTTLVTTKDPYTGDSVGASATWKFFDTAVVTQLGNLEQTIVNANGGAASGKPAQLRVNCSEGRFLYVICTTLNSLTRVRCNFRPVQSSPSYTNGAIKSET